MRIERLDHLVLTVASIEVSCTFYQRVLGMTIVSFGQGRKALAFGNQKINLHLSGREFAPHALHPAPGSADGPGPTSRQSCALAVTPFTPSR